MKIKDTDHGYRKRVRVIKEMAEDRPDVTVGIHEAEGNVDDGGATVLEIAIWNEFGTSRIPERSFLRAWFDENRERNKELWTDLMRRVAKGRMTQEQALEQFGQLCVGEIQARISAGIPPPNAASTIRQKGSSMPLINTGVLRSSITYAVKP